ncbi:MAG: hypothetical protein ACXWNK_15775 [Vulcanimicrobiaceae bacterium]
MRRTLLIVSCACLIGGCSRGGGTPSAHPSGWSVVTGKSGPVYTHANQTFLLKKSAFDGTINDYASQLTTSVVLQNHTAKFLRSLPLPDCPDEAGLQIFDVDGKKPSIMEAAFTINGDTAITVIYIRPRDAPEDPGAHAAIKQDVCTVVT